MTPAPNRSTSRERREHIDDFVSALLTASRALVAVSVRSLSELDDTITLPQFRTLVVLDSHKVMNLNRLADVLGVNASSAVRMIDRLLAAGLVTRQENPENRRQVLLGLTDEGTAVVRRVTARRRREITRIVTAIPDATRTELVQALRVFSDAADEREPQADEDEISAFGW